MDSKQKRLKNLLQVAAGESPADTVLKNGKIVNVFSHEIEEGDLAISGERVAGIGSYSGREEIDLQGAFVAPGFIDAHVHIESSMLAPLEFARLVAPMGTTTVIADPHEIASVCGVDGIRYMLATGETLPLSLYFMLPSSVPIFSFEETGAVLDADTLKELIDCQQILGVGEMMDFPDVIEAGEKSLSKLLLAKERGKIVDGHAPSLEGRDLTIYAAAGVATDHEAVEAASLISRLKRGMYTLVREGTAAKNLEQLLPAITADNARRCAFCTDDKHLGDILQNGHINGVVRKAISLGMPPIRALSMATLNAAECYGLKRRGALAPGYLADIAIFDSWESMRVERVYQKGRLIAKEGEPLFDVPPTSTKKVTNTVHIRETTEKELTIKMAQPLANVIRVEPKTLITQKVVRKVALSEEGAFTYTKEADIAKLVAVERHRATGHIGLGLVENYHIKNGAIGCTIAHDSHNLVAIGDNDNDILTVIKELTNLGGGISISSGGTVEKSLKLPIAGLMSEKPASQIRKTLNEMLTVAYEKLNINRDIDPFMTLSFLLLPVIPQLKLTTRGLFDVTKMDFITIDQLIEEH